MSTSVCLLQRRIQEISGYILQSLDFVRRLWLKQQTCSPMFICNANDYVRLVVILYNAKTFSRGTGKHFRHPSGEKGAKMPLPRLRLPASCELGNPRGLLFPVTLQRMNGRRSHRATGYKLDCLGRLWRFVAMSIYGS